MRTGFSPVFIFIFVDQSASRRSTLNSYQRVRRSVSVQIVRNVWHSSDSSVPAACRGREAIRSSPTVMTGMALPDFSELAAKLVSIFASSARLDESSRSNANVSPSLGW